MDRSCLLLPHRAAMFALLASTVSYVATAAAVVHVSVDGDDGHPGTKQQPVATLSKALALVWDSKEPSEIVIHEGVYAGGVSVGTGKDRDIEGRPGLVIRAARTRDGSFEEVVLEGGLKIEGAQAVPGTPGVSKISGTYSYQRRPHLWESDTRTRYTLVADLAAVARYPASFWYSRSEIFFHTSDGRPPSAHDMGRSLQNAGITVWRQNVTVKGLKFRDFLAWRYGCAVDLRTSNGTVEDCEARNCVRGFTVSMERPRDCRIARCRTDDCGMGVFSHGTRTIVEDCRFIKIRDAFMVPAYPQDDTGIQFYYPAFEGEVRRNLCVGFCNGIFIKCRVSRFIVEHNTCLEGITHGIGCTGWHPQSVFRYNLVSGFSIPILGHNALKPTTVVDYNCLWDAARPDALGPYLDGPRKTGTGKNTIAADPMLAAAVAGDYRLLPDSPCASMGPDGQNCGAFGPVTRDFRDVQPPTVRLSLAEPAQRVARTRELYRRRDAWMGGAPDRVREAVDEWITPAPGVKLKIEAHDHLSKPTLVEIALGTGAKGTPEPYRPEVDIELPGTSRLTRLRVRVADEAGNWSEALTLLVRLATVGPRLVGEPSVRTNVNGAILVFETDTPCKVTAEFGEDARYGRALAQPDNAQRSWLDSRAGDTEDAAQLRVTSSLALLAPLVGPGRTYHYRLVLEDELGNRTETGDMTVTLTGEPTSHFLSPVGDDVEDGGTRQRPWRTIQFAVDRALPGDRVVLLPGVYPGESVLTHGGVEGAPLTIESDSPGAAVLDSRHHAKTCLRLEHAPHVVIKGLEVRWFGKGDTFYSYDKAGIDVRDSPHVTVANCEIWNDFWMGWPIGSGIAAWRSPGLTADHNVIYQMEQGIRLDRSPRSRITHNTILKNMYGAVKFIHSAEGTVSRNNSFCFSGNDQYLVVYADKRELDSFDSDYNNLGTKLRRPDPGDEITPESPFFRHHGSKAVISLNGERYNSLRAWRKATGKDQHSIFADPKYVAPEDWDFHLQPDSPNLGAGEAGRTIGALGVTTPQ